MSRIVEQAKKQQNKDEMLLRALEKIASMYSDKAHFIFELLQNAEDAAATKIMFDYYPDHLDVLHDGRPFTQSNFNALIDVSRSDKVEESSQIGEFGVGFKSVFGICEEVELYSEPSNYSASCDDAGNLEEKCESFAAKITGFVDVSDIEDPDSKLVRDEGFTTQFRFTYKVGNSYSSYGSIEELRNDLPQALQAIDIKTMLFLKSLKQIEFCIHDAPNAPGRNGCIIKEVRTKAKRENRYLISALSENSGGALDECAYLVFSKPVSSGRFASRSVDIAFPIRCSEQGYEFIDEGEQNVSVFFPTETSSGLHFYIQGPFKVTPNRANIRVQDDENIDLVQEVAKLLEHCIIELRDEKKLTLDFLRLLPMFEHKSLNRQNKRLFQSVWDTVERVIKTEDVVPTSGGSYARVSSVCIPRGPIGNLLSDDQLTQLFGDGGKYFWLKESPEDSLVKKLRVAGTIEIRPESFIDKVRLNPEFLQAQEGAWLIEMYKFFCEREMLRELRAVPIVKTNKGTFERAFEGEQQRVFLPSVNGSRESNIEQEDDFLYVDEAMFKGCPDFFKDVLKLKEPNYFTAFIDKASRRYSDSDVSSEQAINDARTLLDYLGDHESQVEDFIQREFKLLCYNGLGKKKLLPISAKPQLPVSTHGIDVQKYYRGIDDGKWYVDADSYKQAGIEKEDLIKLGASDLGDLIIEGPRDGELSGYAYHPSWAVMGDEGFLWCLSMSKLAEALKWISAHPDDDSSYAKSHTILKLLAGFSPSVLVDGSIHVGGDKHGDLTHQRAFAINVLRHEEQIEDLPQFETKLPRIVEDKDLSQEWDGKWLFDKEKRLVSQSEISKYELNTAIYGDVDEASQIYDILGFAHKDIDAAHGMRKRLQELPEYIRKELLIGGIRSLSDSGVELLKDVVGGMSTAGRNELAAYMTTLAPQCESATGWLPNATYEWSFNNSVAAFPERPVKNWERLKAHAVESFAAADPVRYEKVLRRKRTSEISNLRRDYLESLYEYEYEYGRCAYYCQICQKPSNYFEAVQVLPNEKLELEQMVLCLCPNCSKRYKDTRCNSNSQMDKLIESLKEIDEEDLETDEPFIVKLNDFDIRFVKTHAAEISELLKLMEQDND